MILGCPLIQQAAVPGSSLGLSVFGALPGQQCVMGTSPLQLDTRVLGTLAVLRANQHGSAHAEDGLLPSHQAGQE